MNFYIVTLIKFGLVAFVFLTALAYLQWIERKVIAHVQVRVGPNRVGPHGLLQPLVDTIKLLTKEDVLPAQVNKFFYFLAPILSVSCALVGIAVIPFGPKINIFGVETYMQLTDLNIGVLVLLAGSGLGVYGIAIAGWASNNKYALLGGLRASAQMISYELPMALSIAIPLLVYNSLSMREIVEAQNHFYFGFIPAWGIFQGILGPFLFLAFIIFMICAFAETNRIPFDLPEAENELVAGFHTEYASMKFAAFFMAEYANMVNICCLGTHLFLGGWVPLFPAPYSDFVPVALFVAAGGFCLYHGLVNPRIKMDGYTLPVFGVAFIGFGLAHMAPVLKDILVPLFWFLSKAGFLLFLYIWVRATLPRFRYDQLMDFAWIKMFPASIVLLFIVGLLVALGF